MGAAKAKRQRVHHCGHAKAEQSMAAAHCTELPARQKKKNATLKQGMFHKLSKEKYTTGASGW
jgi:hypothetical protein